MMKRKLSKYWAFYLFTCLFALSCSDNSDPMIDEIFVCDEEKVSYVMDIQPIFKSTCAISGCHVNNFAWGNFNDYWEIKSRIQFIVENVFDFGIMPPPETNGPKELTEEQLELLDCWIRLGAPNN